MPTEFRHCKVTLSHFSPLGVVFTSRAGSLPWQVTLAAAGSFATVFGLIDLFSGLSGSPMIAAIAFFLGAGSAGWILYLRCRAPEISLIASSRMIRCAPGGKNPISFSEISQGCIRPIRDKWAVELALKSGSKITLVDDYPLNLAVRIATGIGSLLGVPILGEKGNAIKLTAAGDWKLPYQLPSGRFPIEYLLMAGSLAAAIAVAFLIRIGSMFSIENAARWILMAVLAIPGARLISHIQDGKGIRSAVIILSLFLPVFVLLTLWSLVEPVMTFWGLIISVISAWLLIHSILDKRNQRLWIMAGSIGAAAGLIFSGYVSFHYHSFFNMDPSFVGSIRFSWEDGREMKTEYPFVIRNILEILQSGRVRRESLEPASVNISVEVNRPAGKTYFMELNREGKGSRTQAVYHLSCSSPSGRLYLGTVASREMDTALASVDALSGYWPPGY